MTAPPPGRFDAIYRAEFGRAVAALTRATGDLGVAEDAVQEAFTRALWRWPEQGVPDRPGAWITTVARRLALDRLRREQARTGKETEAVLLAPDDAARLVPDAPAGVLADDRLRLLFTCAHPALAPEARVALTLRLVCGLRTPEIARAFLVPEPTVAQRISRAKAKIRRAGIPLTLPPPHRLPDRVPAVLSVVYLVFSEGYFATSGEFAVRDDLCEEAVRLGVLLRGLPAGEYAAQAEALLALMLLQDSRRAARRGPDGALIPLERQDRSRWDHERIAAGLRCLRAAADAPGPYLPQARIAAAHATAPNWEVTDWSAVVAAYDDLLRLGAAAPVHVNRAVALSFLAGPAAGLAALDAVAADPRLAGGHQLNAAYADLHRRAGHWPEAAARYRAAIPTAGTDPVRRFLTDRLAEVEAHLGSAGSRS